MNGERVVLAVIKGSPSTSSNFFQAATMNRSYRTNDTNDNPSVWIPPRRTSGLFLCVRQTDVQTCSTSSGISMFREGPLHIATSLRHRTPSKPHSTSMVNLVVLTRTCLNMLHWEFLKSNIVYHGCNTYHVRGKACFSMVFNGFPHDGIAVPLGPLWFLPHPLRVLLPRKMFLVQRSKHCRPHCRQLFNRCGLQHFEHEPATEAHGACGN